MSESFAGITVPEGEPGELRSAGQTFAGISGALQGVSSELGALPGLLSAWRGPASVNYSGSALTNETALGSATEAMQSASVASNRYADRLEEAQDEARRAIEQARLAQERIDRAQADIDAAQGRAALARVNLVAASGRVLATGLTGLPSLDALADQAAAERGIGEAEADEGRARRELEQAEEDLKRAQERGRRAEEDARDAAQAVAGAFGMAGASSPAMAAFGAPGSALAGGGASPFDAWGRITRLDLTVADFDRMSTQERLHWIQQFQRQYSDEYEIEGWFRNVEGILNFAEDKETIQSGNWFSLVDASILHGVQGGMALARGEAVTSPNPGAAKWQAFFEARKGGDPARALPTDADSKRLWGAAEQASTDYGVDVVAPAHGQRPNFPEQVVLGVGDFYREEILGEGRGGGLMDPRNREFTQDSAEAMYDLSGEGQEVVQETTREGSEVVREVSEAPWYRKPDQVLEGGAETSWEAIEGTGEFGGQIAEGIWDTGDDVLGEAVDQVGKLLP